jgi:hypothetical protein
VKLDYALDALEPAIDAKTMTFHYGTHYKVRRRGAARHATARHGTPRNATERRWKQARQRCPAQALAPAPPLRRTPRATATPQAYVDNLNNATAAAGDRVKARSNLTGGCCAGCVQGRLGCRFGGGACCPNCSARKCVCPVAVKACRRA